MGGFSVYDVSVWVVPVILAITLHEAAHAWVAWKLGDDTAYRRGRVSFNPVKHIHPVGTILLPALLLFLRAPFLLGWARPVRILENAVVSAVMLFAMRSSASFFRSLIIALSFFLNQGALFATHNNIQQRAGFGHTEYPQGHFLLPAQADGG